MTNISQNYIFKLTNFIASLSFFGGLIYLLWGLNFWACLLSLLLSITLQVLLYGKPKIAKISLPKPELSWLWLILLIGSEFLLLKSAASANSLSSPWEVVPQLFWLLLIPIILILLTKKVPLFFYSLFFFLLLSISAIVYKIGFGFDPFIHLTAMEIIAEKGFILPKTIYYAGQYGLLLPLNKILGLNLELLNRFILPLLTAILLPLTIKKSLKVDNRVILLSAILGFGIFTFLSPQNLGWLLLFIVSLWSFSSDTKDHKYYIGQGIMALAAFICQPLAGLPALVILAKDLIKDRQVLLGLLSLGTIVAIPLLFIISGQGKIDGSVDFSLLKDLVRKVSWPNQQVLSLNLAYLYGFNKFIIFSALLIYGWSKKYYSYLIISGSLLISGLLSSGLDFNLISYEQNDFPGRLFLAAGIIISPLAIIALNKLFKKLIASGNIVKFSALIISLIVILAAVYLAYPRRDRYYNSHNFSSSSSDLKAIELIESHAKNSYTVLANQQVSVLALRKYQFQAENYSLPSSGGLYQYYLKMVYNSPSKTTALEASNRDAYLVLNNYWTDYKNIKEKAILEADEYFEIDEGKVTVFYYKK